VSVQASGYVFSVLPVAVATACALWPVHSALRRLGTAIYVAGFVASQLPVPLACYLLASTALCLAQDELWSASGLVGLALTLCALSGLGTLVARALPTRQVVERAMVAYALAEDRPGGPGSPSATSLGTRPMAAALLVPFLRRRRDVKRMADLAYGGAGRFQRLDLYRHRSRPEGAPVFVYFHGGHFHSGSKNREALPLLYRLAANGWFVISANYRLAPAAAFPDAHIDAKLVLAWVGKHVTAFGGDPRTIVIAGDSAGAHLAAFAGLTANDPTYQPGFEQADTTVTAVVGLGGYYGPLDAARPETSPLAHARDDAPPFLLFHGDRDSVIPVQSARAFAASLRAISHAPVELVELPGAQHAFDQFQTLHSMPVATAIEAFTAWGSPALTGDYSNVAG
jgi:acetyl esterase/lipase